MKVKMKISEGKGRRVHEGAAEDVKVRERVRIK